MQTRERGYTFIELLIVTSILAVLTTGSIVAFVRFRERQQVLSDVLGAAEHLRRIQVAASAVDVPVGCTGVNNYTVTMSGATMSVAVNCDLGSLEESSLLQYTMTSSVYAANYTVVFDSRTVASTALTVNVCGNHYLYSISISALANISQPTYIGSC